MKLAASNIGWHSEWDEDILRHMSESGYEGLEIAPTRLFPEHPYDHIREAQVYADRLKREFGLTICSMQSIWFGRGERIAATAKNYATLLDYTKKAIFFAAAVGCENLVFGCPRNRAVESTQEKEVVEDFLMRCGELACAHGVVIALEPNPVIYHTNFVNTTMQALDLLRQLDQPGLRLNLDFGTVIENVEGLDWIGADSKLIHHVHISEPDLIPIRENSKHQKLIEQLRSVNYNRFISVEMKATEGKDEILKALSYLKTITMERRELSV